MQWDRSLLTDVELLSAADCVRILGGVASLRSLWVQRHPIVPFFTLGASQHFDFVKDAPYYPKVRATNPILMREFGWVYEALASSLQGLFERPVEYPAKLALPGFHIFLPHEALRKPRPLMTHEWFQMRDDPSFYSSPIHCDNQPYDVDWRGISDVSLEQPISITMAVGLPENSPSGMYVWDVYLQETANMPEPQIKAILQTRPARLHPYQVGRFCLHTGLRYHYVAPFLLAPSEQFQPNDVRVTLQGHGIIGRESIKLFW